MQCLVAAVRPFHVEELAEILAFDFNTKGTPKLNRDWRWEGQEEAVMSACSSLVEADGSRIVQFSHFTVKEFRMSNWLGESSRDVSGCHIQLETAHTILAKACLGVLLRLDDRVNHDSIRSFPLAQYAAEHWAELGRFEDVSSRIEDEVDCLFDAEKPHFAVWLWIYDQDYPRLPTPGMEPSQPDTVPLYYAALLGFRDLAERFLANKHPEDVNAKGGYYSTPLHASVLGGYISDYSLLIDYFPEVDVRDGFGQTALHIDSIMAGTSQNWATTAQSWRKSGSAEQRWLDVAATWGRLEFVRMLLERRASINVPNNIGVSPLHSAIRQGHVAVVRLLLEHGADVNTRDRRGTTPSEEASRSGLREIAQVLSDHGGRSGRE